MLSVEYVDSLVHKFKYMRRLLKIMLMIFLQELILQYLLMDKQPVEKHIQCLEIRLQKHQQELFLEHCSIRII